MSQIYRLQIRGVRSFDPELVEQIEFGKPLTLITGQNGSGKTTIIECLKYATTGDLPPNSKGGAFIHDPKITGEREVRAQVKLGFTSASGALMTTTRTIQLLVKKTTTQFKTLEGQLMVVKDGQKATISTKCAELDTQLPLYLGVSKAILEYVIFCHQEDSLWPLAEPAIVKKRFDEIFEALKFTKALDTLQLCRKTMTADIKLLQQGVQHLQADRDRADRTATRVETIGAQIDAYVAETTVLAQKLEAVSADTDRLFKSHQEFQQVLAQAEALAHLRSLLLQQVAQWREGLEEVLGTDEELRARLESGDTVLVHTQERVEALKQEVGQLKSEEGGVRDRYTGLIREEALFHDATQRHLEVVAARDLLVESLAGELGVGAVVAGFGEALTLALAARRETQAALSKTHASALAAAEGAVTASRDSVTREQLHREYQAQDASSVRAVLVEARQRVDQAEFSEGKLAYERLVLAQAQQQLGEARTGGIDDKMLSLLREQERVAEAHLESLQQQVAAAHRMLGSQAKALWLRDEEGHRALAFAAVVAAAHAQHRAVMGQPLGDGLEAVMKQVRSYKEAVDTAATEAGEAAAAASALSAAAETAAGQLEAAVAKAAALDHEFAATTARVAAVLPKDVPLLLYSSFVEDLEEEHRMALEAEQLEQAMCDFQARALELADRQKMCALCCRGFSDKELAAFRQLLSERAGSGGSGELVLIKRDLDAVRKVAGDVARSEVLQAQRDEAGGVQQAAEKTAGGAKEAAVQAEAAAVAARARCELLALLAACMGEIQSLGEEVLRLREQIAASPPPELVPLVDGLLREQEKAGVEAKTLRQQVSGLVEQQGAHAKEVARLEAVVHKAEAVVAQLEQQRVEKASAEREVALAVERLAAMEAAEAKSSQVLAELEAGLETAVAAVRELAAQHLAEMGECVAGVARYEEAGTKWSLFGEAIAQYEARAAEHQSLAAAIAAAETRAGDIERLVAAHLEEIGTLERQLASQDSTARTIRSNLELRRLQQELETVSQQLAASSALVAAATALRDEYQAQLLVLRQQYADLTAQHASRMGEVKQLEQQVAQLQFELDTEFKGVHEKYQAERLRLQAKEMSLGDLAAYAQALDKAIMHYHGVKMKEINTIVDELWKRTYSGTDVDTIAIKLDAVGKANRSYNYRVVMVKQGVELDMRGRCSAGQKVLASIIVRLALAECFGVNCGMLALDEPTTNLDTDNIEALARALNQIIGVRRHQKNFQLIVITHDEKFLAHIGAVQYTDVFYRVVRNERQKSVIQQVGIGGLAE